jgi:hypothetical protein
MLTSFLLTALVSAPFSCLDDLLPYACQNMQVARYHVPQEAVCGVDTIPNLFFFKEPFPGFIFVALYLHPSPEQWVIYALARTKEPDLSSGSPLRDFEATVEAFIDSTVLTEDQVPHDRVVFSRALHAFLKEHVPVVLEGLPSCTDCVLVRVRLNVNRDFFTAEELISYLYKMHGGFLYECRR